MFLELAGACICAAALAPEIKQLDATYRIRSLTYLHGRALQMLSYAGALRRSERVASEREDVAFTAEDLRLQTPCRKTDTAGQGAALGIPCRVKPEICPVRAQVT